MELLTLGSIGSDWMSYFFAYGDDEPGNDHMTMGYDIGSILVEISGRRGRGCVIVCIYIYVYDYIIYIYYISNCIYVCNYMYM